jgi:hypothetical protein
VNGEDEEGDGEESEVEEDQGTAGSKGSITGGQGPFNRFSIQPWAVPQHAICSALC